MGVYIYTIKDRESGEVLYTGRETAAARYLGCSEKYLYYMAIGVHRTGGKGQYNRVEITRQWQDAQVHCVDCGVEIPGAAPTRERCDACNEVRKRQREKEYRKKHKILRGENRVEYEVTQEELQKGCIGCFYFGGKSYINRSCNYIFMEGHSRGCPPGAGCTKRKERK